MASFFQRGELLAPDTVGVPADEVRGDKDEHRAHGRGQKQLIRVEIAAGIARVLGEDGRRRLERDGPDDERVDDAREHHGQHDVDDHLHALRRACAPGRRIVARRGGEQPRHGEVSGHDARAADAQQRHGVADELDAVGDQAAEHLQNCHGVIKLLLAEAVHDLAREDGQHGRGKYDDADGQDVVLNAERDLDERDHVRLPQLHGKAGEHHAEKADVDHLIGADVRRAESVEHVAQVRVALHGAQGRTVAEDAQAEHAGRTRQAAEYEEKPRPVAVYGHAVKAREDHNQREDGHDAQHDVHDAAVRDVGHIRDPGGKGRVVGRAADGRHDAVHDDEERHRETDVAADLPVAEERERRRHDAPEDIPPADEGAALAHAVRPCGAEDRRERGGDGAGRDGRGRRPAGSRDVFLNVGGKIDVFDHPGDLPDEAEHQQTRPDARAERRRLFDDQFLLHESSPLCKALSPDYTMLCPARQPKSRRQARCNRLGNVFVSPRTKNIKNFLCFCIKKRSWRIITAERK